MNNFRELYESVYNQIILNGKNQRFDGSHAHRINPGHNGGLYIPENVIFISQREHSIIHWLRWKLYKNSCDYRAYKMIGIGPSGLSHEDRVNHGKYCYENNIGFYSSSKQDRLKYSYNGYLKQKELYEKYGDKNFYYWSTDEGRKERARLGGKNSCKNNLKFIENYGSFKKNKELAVRAGKNSGKKPVTNGIVTKKFKTDEEVELFLQENLDWRRGCHYTKKKKSA
jgi:hypothetical protein